MDVARSIHDAAILFDHRSEVEPKLLWLWSHKNEQSIINKTKIIIPNYRNMKLISLVTIFAGFSIASALTRTECLTNCDRALVGTLPSNLGRCQQDCDSMTFNSRETCPQNCRSNFCSGNRLDRCYEMCGTRPRFLETDAQSEVLDTTTAASVEAGRLEGSPPTLTTVEQGMAVCPRGYTCKCRRFDGSGCYIVDSLDVCPAGFCLETDIQSKVLDTATAASVEAGRLEGLPPTLTTVKQGQLSLRSSRARGECHDNCRLAGDRDPNFSSARCRQDCDNMSFNRSSTCSQNCNSNFSSGNRLDRCLDGCLAADSRSESRCLRARNCRECSDNCLSSTGSGSEQDLCFRDVDRRNRCL